MRLSPLSALISAEATARIEMEGQLTFTLRKLRILQKHEAHEIERASSTCVTISPAAEVENRRIHSMVMSAKSNLQRIREGRASPSPVKAAAVVSRKYSQYEIDMLQSRRHVALLAAVAALRGEEGDRRGLIERDQATSRALLARLYLKNLTQNLHSLKVSTEKSLRPPVVH